MENQSRRQNIVFHNMPKKRQNVTWDDCERAMREVRQTENRCRHIAGSCPPCGSSIIIRLQNYKDKDLILKNAHKRKRQDTKIGIYVDFSRDVREKRKGLLGMLRSYQQDNIEAALVFDKLLTPDGLFTFDTEFKQIKQTSGPRPGYTRDANSKQQHVDSATTVSGTKRQWPAEEESSTCSEQ